MAHSGPQWTPQHTGNKASLRSSDREVSARSGKSSRLRERHPTRNSGYATTSSMPGALVEGDVGGSHQIVSRKRNDGEQPPSRPGHWCLIVTSAHGFILPARVPSRYTAQSGRRFWLDGGSGHHSILVHLQKTPFSPTQPLIRPRLFPIWKRFPWIAFTRCRYCLPFTLHSTMSPALTVTVSTGSTVQGVPAQPLHHGGHDAPTPKRLRQPVADLGPVGLADLEPSEPQPPIRASSLVRMAK